MFLGAAPRAFKNRPGSILPVFKLAKYVSDEHFFWKAGNTAPSTFKSRPEKISLVLKTFQQIQKLLKLNG
jgi:hypothetical protein